MADGSFAVDTDATAEIRQAVAKAKLGKVHLLAYEAGVLKTRYVVTAANPSRGGIKITARSPGILLGSGSDGPTIIDTEFVAGNNRLNNGTFEAFGADAADPLYWKRDPDKSLWAFVGTSMAGGNYAAVMVGLPDDDDVLVSDDTVEALPGSVWELSAFIARGGATNPGRIRLRLAFEGLFTHIDQIAAQNAGFDYSGSSSPAGDITRGNPDPLGLITGQCLTVRTIQRDLITNPTFNSGFTGWVQTAGSWGTVAGPDGQIARTAGGGPTFKILTADPDAFPLEWFHVLDGEEYDFRGWLSQEAGTDGFGIITCKVVAFPADATKPDYYEEIARKAGDGDLGWYSHSTTIRIKDGYNLISPSIQAHLHTAGAWVFDNVNLHRVVGNLDAFTMPPLVLANKRAYRWTMPFRSDAGVNTGTVQLRAVCNGGGRPTTTLQGMVLAPTNGAVQSISWEFTVPSGYDIVQLQIASQDIYGGAFYIGQGTLTETDNTTLVADVYGPGAPYDGAVRPYAQSSGTITTPGGASKAHVEVIAEAGAFGYTVDNVSLRRVDRSPVPAADVVRALLNDPHTGLPIINPGTINDAGPLGYDWHVKNLVVGEALKTVSTTGQVNPAREYRINADRTYDWGLSSELFTDHNGQGGNALILLRRGQLKLLTPLEGSSTVDKVIDEVRVVGAERTAADKTHQTITVDGSLPTATTADAFGRPLRQTRTITDSGVDSYFLGAERVILELANAQPGPPSVAVEVSEAKDWPACNPGDWIYVDSPEADLTDPANEMTDPETGVAVWPMRLRVIDRTVTATKGSRTLELVDPATQEAGEGLDITDAVRWSDKATQRFTLGARRPEFLTNPAGGSTADQLRRYFASVTRV